MYIYIKVLLVLSGHVGGDAGVAASVLHLGLLDLHHPTAGRDADVGVGPQDLTEEQHNEWDEPSDVGTPYRTVGLGLIK